MGICCSYHFFQFLNPFKIDDDEFQEYTASSYSSVATPILRWGPSVIKGYAQPNELVST